MSGGEVWKAYAPQRNEGDTIYGSDWIVSKEKRSGSSRVRGELWEKAGKITPRHVSLDPSHDIPARLNPP